MLFTEEELRLESRPLCALAEEALRQGQTDRLRYLLGKMSVAHFDLFFGYLHWFTRLIGKIFMDFHEPYFLRVLSRLAAGLMAPVGEKIRQGEEKEAFSHLVALWLHQMGRVEPLGETENQLVFGVAPCGSGGRLQLEAWYEMQPRVYPGLESGKPLFCRFCEHLQGALNEATGRATWLVSPETRRKGFCRMSFEKQRTRGDRMFDTDELTRLTTPRYKQALAMLDQGNLDIQDLLEQQHTEWRPLHDFFCLAVTGLLSVIYEDQGIDYLSGLVRDTYGTLFESAYVMYSMVDDRTLFRNLVKNWYYHQATFRVSEEEDRFVFHLDPCGSGGRLLRGEMGDASCFRYGDGFLCEIGEAGDTTFNRAPFPTYCTHCAVTNRDQFLGRPWAFLVDGRVQTQPGSPCRQYLYKKGAERSPPAGLLAQVGLTEAEPLKEEYRL